jgi:hypothetical protein
MVQAKAQTETEVTSTSFRFRKFDKVSFSDIFKQRAQWRQQFQKVSETGLLLLVLHWGQESKMKNSLVLAAQTPGYEKFRETTYNSLTANILELRVVVELPSGRFECGWSCGGGQWRCWQCVGWLGGLDCDESQQVYPMP